MTKILCLYLSARGWLLFSVATVPSAQAADSIVLDRAAIVADKDEASFVQYGVEELAGYLKESTGNEIPVVASSDGTHPVQVVVGAKAVQRMLPECLPDKALGEEGYRVRVLSRNGVTYVSTAGTTSRGTKAALAMLMKAIRVEGKSACVPTGLSQVGKPALTRRGMHFNGWAFNYPYSFRSWREEDWHRYLDVLAYQGVTLFYLWPFIEIMPVPLSPEDQAYLEECRRVVDYAQKKHGMEVWIMQCTNRVAKDRCGVADPRLRPYWRPSQEDLNPGNPEHFQAIMASREAMYRIINNADGVCNIDSDPGFYPGSPLSDYMKVLQGCRAMLDRHNLHGKQTKLINWLLWGWGRTDRISPAGLDEHQLRALRGTKQGLPEPWELMCTHSSFLPICRQEKVLERTIFLPYGSIEGEPSYPSTNVTIDAIRQTFDNPIDKFPELAGAMGNVQTPLLQFPNVYFYTSAMWDADYRKRSEREVLLDLAGHLYPEHKELLADGYLALKEPAPAKVEALANRLDGVLREDRLGRPGLFGRKLFPDRGIVAKALLLQLRLRAAQERLTRGIAPTTPKAECETLLCNYFDAYLAWDTAHGWHGLWGWQQWPPSDGRFPAVAKGLLASLGSRSEVDACLERIARTLSAKYDEKAVREGCIAHWKRLL